ncbi:DUF4192 family protein [Microbacterium aurantiacum]|uniref:DUF4192 family protein n=1 Tax=Microbacterium aurantiacum TaxID=162393 RepID=A0A0M8ML72_9MICO|nr:DUF4192 family protein [Microbacterium chocolatum]ANG86371.1 hypothetical protein A8L33_14295 [Microbacterium chocolatum]KOS09704.1 hypothetical protein XI38_14475 [Microbacterium chocolatum]
MNIVSASTEGQFLSMIPALLGHTPTHSVIVIPFANGRTKGAMRIDLPDTARIDAVARMATGAMCKVEGADAFAVAVYTDAPADAAIAERFTHYATVCGLRLMGAFYVTGNAWGTIGSDTAPEPLPDTPAGLPAVEGDQHHGARLPDVDPAHRAAMLTAIVHTDPADLDYARILDTAEDAATSDTLTDEARAILAVAMTRPALRDVALVSWATDRFTGDRAADAQNGWENGAEYPQELAAIIWGDAPRPDSTRLTRALEVARRIAATVPDDIKPGPLAVAAWLSWALGRSTHADAYAVQAENIDPKHGFARIIRQFVQAGHTPDWAYRS